MRSVDIVILNAVLPFLKNQILKTGRILFDKNRRLRVRFTEKAIAEYLDYKPVEDIFQVVICNKKDLQAKFKTNRLEIIFFMPVFDTVAREF
jgi:hypothetical protein